MGSKIEARALMDAAGVPIVPGVTDPVDTVADARTIAEDIGYPVAVKAAAGGGGKGFRVALTPADLEDAFEGARREAEKFFADTVVYLERYLPHPRHVEIQILADAPATASGWASATARCSAGTRSSSRRHRVPWCPTTCGSGWVRRRSAPPAPSTTSRPGPSSIWSPARSSSSSR